MEQIETIGATEQRELTRIQISVRNLVEFIFRSGDIDNRIGKGAQKEAMQEGSRMHRKIQGRMGMEYRAEVPLKLEVPQEQYVLALEGRADGIITNVDGVTVDEIKCMYTVLRNRFLCTRHRRCVMRIFMHCRTDWIRFPCS